MEKNQRFSRWLAFRILLIAGLAAWPRVSGWAAAPPGNQGTQSLDAVLNADGTLKQGVNGSFNPRGFKMRYTKDGAPCFAAEAQNASSLAGVCSDSWDDRFINSGLDDRVYALSISGSDVYVGGYFTTADDVIVNHVAKWNGTSWSSLGNGIAGRVYSLAVSGSTLYAGGAFSALCNDAFCSMTTAISPGVAQWNGTSWSSVGTTSGGPGGIVYALAVSGSTLYAGGLFAITPAGFNDIAQWNGTSWSTLGNGFNGPVVALTVSGSTLYAGGSFTATCNNAACSATTTGFNGIAQWNGTSWSTLGNGFNNSSHSDNVLALAVSGGTLYAGGHFIGLCTNAACSSTTPGFNHIAQWNGTSWSTLANGVDSDVKALTVSGGTLYAGGFFTGACNNAACSTTTAGFNYIGQWNGASWATVGSGFDSLPASTTFQEHVLALGASGGTLYAGGDFNAAAGGISAIHHLAQWNGTSWSKVGAIGDHSVGNNEVLALAISGSDVYAGGLFRTAGGAVVNYIAKWDGTNWSSVGNGFNSNVDALAVSGGILYAGGNFTAVCNDQPCTATTAGFNHIAQWNGTAWSTLGNGVDSDVYALATSGSTLYVGGDFRAICTNASCGTTTPGFNFIAQWNGTSWSTLGNGFNSDVSALAVSGSTLYAGGFFTKLCTNATCSTTTTGFNGIAQWNGTSWSTLANGLGGSGLVGFSGFVVALAVSGSTVYAGGGFSGVCNDAPCSTTTSGFNSIAQWNGTSWSPLGNGLETLGDTGFGALAVSGNTLYAGSSPCANAACSSITPGFNGIAQWDGTSWSALENGLPGALVTALAPLNGDLYVGGTFHSAGCRISESFALYHPQAGTSQLLNISTRMRVLTGEQVLIAGFIITGTDPKKVIIRGIGPSLNGVGVTLSDPTLELHQGGTTLATNDNWKINDQTGQSQEADIRATTIPPANDLESALVATLNPGAYTAILAGKNGGTGVGLVEVYDLAQAANSKLANISTRGFVDTGNNVMIGGLIVGGSGGGSAKVIVRALGPSLTGSGIAGALGDPTLELHDGNGTTLATNDNWKINDQTGQSQQAEIEATTIPPTNDLESALVATLAPGNYTAIVRGKNNTTGVGLVEVYNLQ